MTMQLDERAREILRANDRGGYTVPNGRVYPFQWNWDSAFVALGFATFDQDRAWRELETLFEAQWPDGFVPHIVFWKDDAGYFPGPAVWGTGRSPLTSGITQPPVASSVVRSLWLRAERSAAFRPRLEQLFPKLFAWHRWFAQVRDPLGKGVVIAVHPWETGRDNSPEWDAPSHAIDTSRVGEYTRRDTTHLDQSMRPTKAEYDRYLALVQAGREMGWDQRRIAREHPFRVADVGMTMMLLRANRDLAALADDLGRKAEAEELRGYVKRAEAGIDYLWDEAIGAYCSRDSINGPVLRPRHERVVPVVLRRAEARGARREHAAALRPHCPTRALPHAEPRSRRSGIRFDPLLAGPGVGRRELHDRHRAERSRLRRTRAARARRTPAR